MESYNFQMKGKNKLNQIGSAIEFDNVNSKYILQLLFNILNKKRLLEIIKYSKKTQQRLDITIKDYKEYSYNYSSVEIDIIPAKNKYGNFIKYINDEMESYYHIYFNNNSKKEIKRNYLYESDYIQSIKIRIGYQVNSFQELFADCECIESLSFQYFIRDNIKNMNSMFYGCSSLKGINFIRFNTNNVSDMGSMFFDCSSLKELNLSQFNTINVINMGYMFSGCSSLQEFSNVNDMKSMFYGCSSLKGLDLSNFNTTKVTDMKCMFYGCSSLKEINLSNFSTNKVKYMRYMFFKCSSLKQLNISHFNINNVDDMKYIFSGCSSLKELCLPNLNTEYKIDMNHMFDGCSAELKKIYFQNRNVSNNFNTNNNNYFL